MKQGHLETNSAQAKTGILICRLLQNPAFQGFVLKKLKSVRHSRCEFAKKQNYECEIYLFK